MSSQRRILCGVPEAHCQGGKLVTDQNVGTKKAHSSHEEAFKCMRHYLVQVQGYKQIGGREFAPPNGGPVRVLTKRMRYGGLLVWGKERGRYMPEKRRVGNRGTIIG